MPPAQQTPATLKRCPKCPLQIAGHAQIEPCSIRMPAHTPEQPRPAPVPPAQSPAEQGCRRLAQLCTAAIASMPQRSSTAGACISIICQASCRAELRVQVEVFRDMYAAEIASMPKGTRRPAGQEDFVPTLFTSATDRLFLMALFLHCADLSNAVKPMSIVDKCALDHLAMPCPSSRRKAWP